MDIFFGTDGWRAYIDSQINEQSVATVAQAFADYVNRQNANKPVAVAYDTRRNSSLFANIFSEVLSGNNIRVLLTKDIIPTPVLSFTTKNLNCFAGVMITASHNPPEYNGIKFKSALGGPFSSDDTKEIEKLLGYSQVRASKDNITCVDMMPAYIEHLEKLIDFPLIRKSGISLLIDSMGGAGTTMLESMLKEKGCRTTTIYGEPSQNFHERLAEPIEKNLHPLMNELKKGDYAFGVATDGDADRVGVCLDNGRWLPAQETILLLVDYLKKVKGYSGGIVKTSSVSDKIRSCFESNYTPVYEVQVGFKYIADIMTRESIAFGGEESGGFGYGIHIPERDGIFSALVLLEMLSYSPYRKLSEYLSIKQNEYGTIHYDRIDMHYDKPDKNNLLPWLFERQIQSAGGFEVKEILPYLSSRGIINGLKYIFEGDCRWLLLRSSETENIIRLYAEGQTAEEVRILLRVGVDLLEEASPNPSTLVPTCREGGEKEKASGNK